MGKKEIFDAVRGFETKDLTQAAFTLLQSVGLESSKQMPLPSKTYDDFISFFCQEGVSFNRDKACVSDWCYIDFLFQLTDEELSLSASKREFDSEADSYLFFCLELVKTTYSRTVLSQITREINKLFLIPALVIFKIGDTITISVINRRRNKRDDNKDVLEKITQIKDISIMSPHRAHIDILHDLSIEQLNAKQSINSFTELHKAWQKVLDTKELNKKFYKELSEWYYWAMGEVYFPNVNARNVMPLTKGQWKSHPDIRETNAKQLIRLLTRILFVWFIKEMKLVSELFFDEKELKTLLKDFHKNDIISNYYKAILQNLFFATLNQEISRRKFRIRGYQGRGITNQWRYENLFADKEKFIELTKMTPFLNGGLFECLDRIVYKTVNGKEVEDKDNSERVDWFSEQDDNYLEVPNKIFFIEEEYADLRQELGDKAKNTKVRGLFNILDDYKFTIAENTPIEEDVALDPELLGNVFENLLASYNPETKSTARNQTGSFYTPKEIVNYMVDESLKLYLKRKLQAETNMTEADINMGIDILFEYSEREHCFTNEEKSVLVTAVDTCKILDPACGSGAFPMGALHRLVDILHKLDPDNSMWLERQKQELLVLSDPVQYDEAVARVEESFFSNELNYSRKLFLIKNCIFGVDVQPVATQISKLRFLISLMVDQNVDYTKPEENYRIQALPNLETRFVTANTLIGLPEQDTQLSLFENAAIRNTQDLIEQVRADMFSVRNIDRKKKLQKQDKELHEQLKRELLNCGANQQATELIAAWDPYDQTASSPFFDSEWMFGVKDGFSIVIGNPPYVQVKKGYVSEIQYPFSEGQDKGKQNLYKVFIEASYNHCCNDGTVCLIVQSSLMCDMSSTFTRKLLLTETILDKIIEFPKKAQETEAQVFESVLQGTCICLFSKLCAEDYIFSISINNNISTLSNLSFEDVRKSYLRNLYPESYNFPLIKKGEFRIIEIINEKSRLLEDFLLEISQGDLNLTGAKEFFSESQTSVRLLRGKNINKYRIIRETDEFVNEDYLTEKVEDNNKNVYIVGQEVTGTLDKWRLHFALSEKEYLFLFGHTANKLLLIDPRLNYYILGLLNSKLLDWYFRKTSTNNHVMGYQLKQLPIPLCDKKRVNEISAVVEKIVEKKLASNDSSALEEKINQMIYEILDFKQDQVSVVEGAI